MSTEELLDSFVNYRIVKKEVKNIRPGDFLLVNSVWQRVRSVSVSTWYDDSIMEYGNLPKSICIRINATIEFENISVPAHLNGEDFYEVKESS